MATSLGWEGGGEVGDAGVEGGELGGGGNDWEKGKMGERVRCRGMSVFGLRGRGKKKGGLIVSLVVRMTKIRVQPESCIQVQLTKLKAAWLRGDASNTVDLDVMFLRLMVAFQACPIFCLKNLETFREHGIGADAPPKKKKKIKVATDHKQDAARAFSDRPKPLPIAFPAQCAHRSIMRVPLMGHSF